MYDGPDYREMKKRGEPRTPDSSPVNEATPANPKLTANQEAGLKSLIFGECHRKGLARPSNEKIVFAFETLAKGEGPHPTMPNELVAIWGKLEEALAIMRKSRSE